MEQSVLLGRFRLARGLAVKRDQALTPEAFQKLLAILDPDVDSAGEKYERIRTRLMKFFQWRECWPPEDYTDRVIDRVAIRLFEGSQLTVEDPYLYFYGVALNLVRESWREPRPASKLPEAVAEPERPSMEDRERSLGCLDQCLSTLPPESRALLFQYHEGQGRAKIDARVRMAAVLRVPLNALRIRAWRLRRSLASCVKDCVERETKPGLAH